MSDTTPSFFSRLSLGFSTLFALLSDPALAARLQTLRTGVPPAPTPTPASVPVLRVATPDAALQLLGLLQREARFIDFIQEDMASYSDADIGAAARLVHVGCGKVLSEHFTLAPARSEAEGTRLVLEAGFDAASTRLTGNLQGQPPFRGVLRHPGWRVTEVRLPRLTEGHDAHILVAAEVEL